MAILVQSNKKPNLTFPTLTGSIVTFNSQYAGLPLKSHKIALTATQSGSGTPSPDNVRNIVGVSSVNIGQTSGYGEYFQGLLNGTYSFVDLGSLTWTLTERYFRADLPIMPRTVNTSETPNAITDSQYQPIDFYSLYNNYGSYDDVFSITNGIAWSNKLYFRDTSYNDTIAFKTAMQGVYLIYELAKPSTPVTPEQFATLCQAFGITGNTYPITFGQTVYGGEYDARTGVLTITHGFIASYNGETINEPWISSMDEYVEGGTPTSGAQVVYPLSTPQTIQLQPCPIDTLEGVNNIWADTGDTTAQCIKIGG
jgi:hypothetical protein